MVQRSAVVLSVSLLLASCGGGGSDDSVGACYVGYAEPVFTIAAVTSTTDATPIADIVISDIVLDGVAYNFMLMPNARPNAEPVGATIRCKVACGFSTSAGTYSMTVSAPGYQAQNATFSADYATSAGACPSIYSGGKRIALSLRPV